MTRCRIDKHLGGDQRSIFIPGHQGDCCGQGAAIAISRDGNALAVGAELRRVFRYPFNAGIAVVDSCGKRMFGR